MLQGGAVVCRSGSRMVSGYRGVTASRAPLAVQGCKGARRRCGARAPYGETIATTAVCIAVWATVFYGVSGYGVRAYILDYPTATITTLD